MNVSGHDHAGCGAEGKELGLNDFVFFRLRDSRTEAGGKVNGHGLGDKAWACVEGQNALPARSGEAGFFEQFALRGREFVFPRLVLAAIDSPGTEFPQILLGGMAILANQQNTRLSAGLVDRHNDDGAGMANNIATTAYA